MSNPYAPLPGRLACPDCRHRMPEGTPVCLRCGHHSPEMAKGMSSGQVVFRRPFRAPSVRHGHTEPFRQLVLAAAIGSPVLLLLAIVLLIALFERVNPSLERSRRRAGGRSAVDDAVVVRRRGPSRPLVRPAADRRPSGGSPAAARGRRAPASARCPRASRGCPPPPARAVRAPR